MSKKIELSIVIPCYNSEKSIFELNKRLNESLNILGVTYEIIYINDCSKDSTLIKLKDLTINNKNIKVIDLMFNVGQFRALYCGLSNIEGKFVVTMDDDLQHRPEDIEKLYYKIKDNDDIDAIFGKIKEKKHSFSRNIGSFIIKRINENIFNKPKNIYMSAFRILRNELVETIVSHKTLFPIFGPLILKSTNRIINIDIEHNSRKYGKSNYSFFMLIKTTLDNIINFSSLPLKYISILGIFVSFISFLLAFVYTIRYFIFDSSVSGWTTLVVLINIYGGLILLSIGIVGEYMVRILTEVQGYPQYRIRKIYQS